MYRPRSSTHTSIQRPRRAGVRSVRGFTASSRRGFAVARSAPLSLPAAFLHWQKIRKKLVKKNFFVKEIANFLELDLSNETTNALSHFGDVVDVFYSLTQKEFTKKEMAIFALKGLRLGLKLAGCFFPLPGIACVAVAWTKQCQNASMTICAMV